MCFGWYWEEQGRVLATGSESSEGFSLPDDTNTSAEKKRKEKVEHVTNRSATGNSKSALQEELKKPIWEVPLAGSKLPSREAFALRKEMVEFRAKKNVIVVTFANHAFMGFVLSWVKSLTDDGVTNILVGNVLILVSLSTLLLQRVKFLKVHRLSTNYPKQAMPSVYKYFLHLIQILFSFDFIPSVCFQILVTSYFLSTSMSLEETY